MKTVEFTMTSNKCLTLVNVENIFNFGKNPDDPTKTCIQFSTTIIRVDESFMETCEKLKSFPYFKPFFNAKSKKIVMVNMHQLNFIRTGETDTDEDDLEKYTELSFRNGNCHAVRETYEEAYASFNEVLNGQ